LTRSNACFASYRKQPSLGIRSWRNRNSVGYQAAAGPSHPACQQTLMKLSQNQNRICQLYPDHMNSVNTGVQLATETCQYQMEWRRWNCSSPSNSSLIQSTVQSGGYIIFQFTPTHSRNSLVLLMIHPLIWQQPMTHLA